MVFDEIPSAFWIASIVVSLVQITGEVLIFALRKLCIPFFVLGVVGNVATSTYILTQTKYLKVLRVEQLFTVVLSSLLPIRDDLVCGVPDAAGDAEVIRP